MVENEQNQLYIVKLANKPSCTCLAKENCHILAVKMYIGEYVPQPVMKFALSQIKMNLRGNKKSGKKYRFNSIPLEGFKLTTFILYYYFYYTIITLKGKVSDTNATITSNNLLCTVCNQPKRPYFNIYQCNKCLSYVHNKCKNHVCSPL